MCEIFVIKCVELACYFKYSRVYTYFVEKKLNKYVELIELYLCDFFSTFMSAFSHYINTLTEFCNIK